MSPDNDVNFGYCGIYESGSEPDIWILINLVLWNEGIEVGHTGAAIRDNLTVCPKYRGLHGWVAAVLWEIIRATRAAAAFCRVIKNHSPVCVGRTGIQI